MARLSQSLTHLIHENLSVVATFAFSRHSLERIRQDKFHGSWKYLDRALFEISSQRAERACVELATHIRLLDDDEAISDQLREAGAGSFGRVTKRNGPDEQLFLRDLTNKIIHAGHLEWDFSDAESPKLICISRDPERWVRAEASIIAIAGFCGQLIA